jgi:hypothetical protein
MRNRPAAGMIVFGILAGAFLFWFFLWLALNDPDWLFRKHRDAF